jgi:hypothetical protein
MHEGCECQCLCVGNEVDGPKELYLGHARCHTPVPRYGGGYHPPIGL